VALPGVNLVIKDQFLGVSRTDIPIGPRVAIIGRRKAAGELATPNTAGTSAFSNPAYPSTVNLSANVADLDPVSPTTEQEVINYFGIGSDLHRGYIEAQRGGASFITCIALPSDTVYNNNSGTITSASYAAVGGTDLFADAFSAAEVARADIIVPWGRGSGPNDFQDPATPGDDDLHYGFFADNSATVANSWAYKVATQCARITADSHPCFAVLGVKPYIGISTGDGGMTPAQVVTHLTLPNLADRNGTESAILLGHYVTVVATEIEPLRYNQYVNFGFANGAATYAGAVTKLDSWSAPTAKTIFNIQRVRYNPTRTSQTNLVDLGVVPVALNFNRVPNWIDGQTFAKDGSDYRRLTTLRIVYDAVLLIRQISQKFIGEAATTATRNALETAVTSGLRGMQQMGALLASDFTITYIGLENRAIIDLVLQPAFELRNIEVRVSVQL
jgi:hypothetical protein